MPYDIDECVASTHMTSLPLRLSWHQPVMVKEVLHYLSPRPGSLVVDGTVGTGGHSLAILPRLLPQGHLVAVDRDSESLEMARQRLREFEPQVTLVHENYRNLPHALSTLGMAQVDGVLLDLGMSSAQVNCAQRGFSFSHAGPLDMRMDPTQSLTAESLINELTAEELTQMFQTLGEERFAKRIASCIVHARRTQPMTTTTALAQVIASAVPAKARYGRLHAATRTFQALRMAVNDELGALEALLASLHALLRVGGRAVILTFHSLEDRLVKRRFVEGAREGLWTLLTKKPIRPSAEEVAHNPRARSAKLRAVERC